MTPQKKEALRSYLITQEQVVNESDGREYLLLVQQGTILGRDDAPRAGTVSVQFFVSFDPNGDSPEEVADALAGELRILADVIQERVRASGVPFRAAVRLGGGGSS